MRHRIKQHPRRQRRDAISAIPDGDSRRLFLAFPPRRRDQHEPRVQAGLENAQEEARGRQAAEGGAGAHAGEDNAPEHEVDGDVFARGVALHEHVGRVLGDQVADVEETDQETEFLALEVRFLDQAVGGCLGDGLVRKRVSHCNNPVCLNTGCGAYQFVDELNAVDDEHEERQAQIDLAQEAFLLVFGVGLEVGVKDL